MRESKIAEYSATRPKNVAGCRRADLSAAGAAQPPSRWLCHDGLDSQRWPSGKRQSTLWCNKMIVRLILLHHTMLSRAARASAAGLARYSVSAGRCTEPCTCDLPPACHTGKLVQDHICAQMLLTRCQQQRSPSNLERLLICLHTVPAAWHPGRIRYSLEL
jgi:hypothetical protein